MALAVPLLLVAGLLLRSVDRLEGQDLSVNRDRVLLVDFGSSLAGPASVAMPRTTINAEPAESAEKARSASSPSSALYVGGASSPQRDLLAAVRAQPHVAAATFASQTPLGGDIHGSSLRVESSAS